MNDAPVIHEHGTVFGKLTVLRRAKPQSGSSCDWVKCDCGNRKFTVRTAQLKAGKVTHCKSGIHRVQDELNRSRAKRNANET